MGIKMAKIKLTLDDFIKRLDEVNLKNWKLRKIIPSTKPTERSTRSVYRTNLGRYTIDVERIQVQWYPGEEEAVSLAIQGTPVPVDLDIYKLRVMKEGKIKRIFDMDERIKGLYSRIDIIYK
jgi:hypothetical protein